MSGKSLTTDNDEIAGTLAANAQSTACVDRGDGQVGAEFIRVARHHIHANAVEADLYVERRDQQTRRAEVHLRCQPFLTLTQVSSGNVALL